MGVRALLRTNFLKNPLGRIAGNLDAGPNITLVTGKPGAVITHTNGVGAGNAFFAVQTGTLVNGTTYYARFIADVVSGTPSVVVAYHSDIGASVNAANVNPVNGVLSRDFSFVATATYGRLLADFNNTGTGESYRLREMVISDTPFSTYWDGSTWETRDRFYKWAGMVDGSVSYEYSIVPDVWTLLGSSLANLKQKMIETILGPTPVRTGTESIQDIKKAALEKLLGDNGLI